MDVFSVQNAIILTLTTYSMALNHVGFENLWAGIITVVVGVWMLSFGLLLLFNRTPGPKPMRINGYILLILSVCSIIANAIVVLISTGSQISSALLLYGIPSLVGLIASILVMLMSYNYVIKHRNFKHQIGMYVIMLGIILVITAIVNFYYYYLYLQLQYFLITNPGAG